MKLISNNLGRIIVALAGVALLITMIVFFKAPIGDFFNNIVDKETAIGDQVLGGLDDIDVKPDLDASSGPVMLEGQNQSFHKLAPTVLTFRSSADIADFQEVQVNGETIDPSNYTVSEGSTVVTMTVDYLMSLNADVHQVKIVSKTGAPSANFEVIEPETNEHGFYYNQPYTAYVSAFGATVVFFMREDGTADNILLENGYVESVPYACNGNVISATTSVGSFTLTISSDGTEIYCNELGVAFKLGDESISADEDYIYIYDASLGGYVVNVIDKTKAEYGAIKTGINGKPTVKLADSAFEDNTNLVKAPKIPDSVTSIGNRAFDGCTSLESVTIPDSVTSIGVLTFDGCTSLESIDIPDSVTSIGGWAFQGCTSLESVTIPDSVTSIGQSAFQDCTGITKVKYAGTLEQWCNFEFTSDVNNPCNSGAELYINGELVKDIVVPNRITKIKQYAFYGCTSLESVTIPDSVTSIGGAAFYGCTSLTSVTIPDSVTSIGNRAFDGCTSLESVTIPDSVTSIDGFTFQNCTSLESVTIPDSVTSIDGLAFRDCTSLTEIHYGGTKEQWNNNVTKGTDWDYHTGNYVIYCTDGEIAK